MRNAAVGHEVAAFDECRFVYNPFKSHTYPASVIRIGSKAQKSTQILYSLKLTN